MTIAGSDSCGGAGVQADLKTFAALGTHGVTAITCVTAQNPRRVVAIAPCRPSIVGRQIEAVWETTPPSALKTGMLYSASVIREVAAVLNQHPSPPLVIDPVMVATSGCRLLQPAALRALQDRLLPRAALVTPNLPEAVILSGRNIANPDQLQIAARTIHARFGCAVLVKGGHLGAGFEAADAFCDARHELILRSRRLRTPPLHGTGCTLSAAVAAFLAHGMQVVPAVERAKRFVTDAIRRRLCVAGHGVLNHFFHPRTQNWS